MLLDEGVAFDDTLMLCFQEVQLLDNVGILLVILTILVDVGEESPVVEVIDGVLKDGIHGLVAPEATMEPAREWLHWLVRGVVGSSVQFDDSCLFLPLCLTVESCHPSIVELLNEAGESLGTIVKGDGEVWEMFSVLLIPGWAFAEVIVVVIIHLLLKGCEIGLKTLDFLPMDIILDLDGSSKSSNDGPELVQGRVRCGSKDILHRGGGEGESPGVSGGESDSRTFLVDFAHSEGIVCSEAEMSWETFSVLFRI